MQLRPGFKGSPAGPIPEQWDAWHLTDLAQIRSGIAKNSKVTPSDPIRVHYLRVANVQDGFLDLSQMSTIIISRSQLNRFRVLPGDVLMNEGGDLDKLGRGSIWLGQLDPCVHQNHVFVVRCGSRISPEYLNTWSGSQAARQFFKVAGKQTTNLASISKTALGELTVVVPPLDEQRFIATALSDADALLTALERLLAKKRNIKHAAMQQLLTGRTRLPGFSNKWSEFSLGEIASPSRNRVDPKRSSPQEFCVELEHIESGTGQLKGHTSTTADSALKSTFSEGDVLFGKLRAYLRKYWFATREGICSTEIWVLQPNCPLLTPTFLFQLVQTEQFIEAASSAYGTHMPRSDWKALKNLQVRLPQPEEQTALATILSDMDSELSAIELRIAKTRALKQAMMQELLTGRTRLIPPKETHA